MALKDTMAILNFKEIPTASAKERKKNRRIDTSIENDDLDTFEKFAEEFFEKVLEYKVISRIARGPDLSMDMIVEKNSIRHLVSCKHYAHGDAAVGVADELAPQTALMVHDCKVFIGFYSTTISAGLQTTLEKLKANCVGHSFDYQIYMSSDIESRLLDKDDAKGWILGARYFPKSYANLFRRFVVPIEHYKLSDVKKMGQAFVLDGPAGGIFSGNVDKKDIVKVANDTITNNIHVSFFCEALREAINAFPDYFLLCSTANINSVELSEISPAWNQPFTPRKNVNHEPGNLPIMVCALWSFWDSTRAIQIYLKYSNKYDLIENPPESKRLVMAKASLQATQSSYLSIGHVASISSGFYRDIFARLLAFSAGVISVKSNTTWISLLEADGKPKTWNFQAGTGLEFISSNLRRSID